MISKAVVYFECFGKEDALNLLESLKKQLELATDDEPVYLHYSYGKGSNSNE